MSMLLLHVAVSIHLKQPMLLQKQCVVDCDFNVVIRLIMSLSMRCDRIAFTYKATARYKCEQ
jgi:hypothetical protein